MSYVSQICIRRHTYVARDIKQCLQSHCCVCGPHWGSLTKDGNCGERDKGCLEGQRW